jgi:hypothetical protein
LAHELERFGLDEAQANALSCEVVAQHPLAHRIGVQSLARRVTRHGLGPDEASHLALALWGLERLWLGACFQDLLEALRRAEVEYAEAYPACIDARRLWSAAGETGPIMAQEEFLLRWLMCSVSLITLGALLLHLGI